MDRIVAPYNFVPVSEHVFTDGGRVSHDLPFRDGITARLRCKVTADTAIIVRGESTAAPERPTSVRFFRTPDDKVAIPGSSLRGLLRNVVEIASFGRLSRVNDHTYGVRDLHNRDVYGQYMAEIRSVPDPRGHGNKQEPVPLVSAGWLRRLSPQERATLRAAASVGRDAPIAEDDADEVVAEIVPCDFYKIEYTRLVDLAAKRGVRNFTPGEPQSSVKKYETWGDASRDVDVQVRVFRPASQQSAAGVPFLGDAGVVVDKGAEVRGGRLVFTGQPSRWNPNAERRRGAGNAKHHDFVFSPGPTSVSPDARRLLITRKQFEVFEFVHADRGQQNRLKVDANNEWGFWQREYLDDKRVPVFVLPERDGSLRAFGLAMMFRLAYRHSVREAIRQDSHRGALDLAERVFGTVPPGVREGGGEGLRGRVSVGLATVSAPPKELAPVVAVLGAPKASFYPNYVEQSDDPNQPGAPPSGRYKTFMDDDARVRGWKRYRPHAKANARPDLPEKAKAKVMTEFVPVAAGTEFDAVVRVHNLRRAELGALVWASRFGGDAHARHTLGMARSLGYGSVRIELGALDALITNDGVSTTLDECERLFVEQMEAWATSQGIPGGWRGSSQITQLLACAQPFATDDEGARHMRIAPFNEFTQAKKDYLALAPAGDVKAWRAVTRGIPQHGPPTPGGANPRSAALGARPSQSAPQTTRTPAPPPAETATIPGKIRYFRSGEVALELTDGRKPRLTLDASKFAGFKVLNGSELTSGRKVTVTMAGEVVVMVRA